MRNWEWFLNIFSCGEGSFCLNLGCCGKSFQGYDASPCNGLSHNTGLKINGETYQHVMENLWFIWGFSFYVLNLWSSVLLFECKLYLLRGMKPFIPVDSRVLSFYNCFFFPLLIFTEFFVSWPGFLSYWV